jgi:RimJ/RimL family protein N-acetyltransferase
MEARDDQLDIRTARLQLRPPRASDAERLFELFADWEVIRWLDSPPWPYTIEHAHAFIAARARPNPAVVTAAIVLDGGLIGMTDARLREGGAMQREPGYHLGYWIGEPFWGRGYMSEAARGFLAHMFAAITQDPITSGAFTDNVASLRVQEKLGFERSGETLSFSEPHQKDIPHTHTVLTRARFQSAGN